MLDFDHQAIMVYGIPALEGPSPSTRVEHDILAEDEPVSVCKA